MMIVQLQTLTGISKGLTRTTDSLLILEESSADQAEAERLQRARDDYRMVKLREDIFGAFRSTIEFWSGDASVSDVRTVPLSSVSSCDAGLGPRRPHSFHYVPTIRYHITLPTRWTAFGVDLHRLSGPLNGCLAITREITRHPTRPSDHYDANAEAISKRGGGGDPD